MLVSIDVNPIKGDRLPRHLSTHKTGQKALHIVIAQQMQRHYAHSRLLIGLLPQQYED
jgi:hypothetical protein